ncbi:MAG TPA: hypothetical protein VIG24_12900 [Acidimicrobiia bacterium]
MMQRDGTLVCFRIETFREGDWRGGYYTDAFGQLSRDLCPVDNYASSGSCWQATGIHAIFDPKKAFMLLDQVEADGERFEGPFRVVRVEIKQKRDVVSREAQGGFYPCK